MTIRTWLSGRQWEYHNTPSFDAVRNQIEQLLHTIELDHVPVSEWVTSIKRQAAAIREELARK